MVRFYDVITTTRRRLAKMGLDVTIEQVNPNYVVMAISWESIMRYIKRHLTRTVDYPKHFIHLDPELQLLTIHIWKGERPQEVTTLVEREKKEEEVEE